MRKRSYNKQANRPDIYERRERESDEVAEARRGRSERLEQAKGRVRERRGGKRGVTGIPVEGVGAHEVAKRGRLSPPNDFHSIRAAFGLPSLCLFPSRTV